MALASMIKDFVHHVPSFNDLNTMPEEPLVGMHSENSGSLDQKLAADQNAQPTVCVCLGAIGPTTARIHSASMHLWQRNSLSQHGAAECAGWGEVSGFRSATSDPFRASIFLNPAARCHQHVPVTNEVLLAGSMPQKLGL